MHKSNHHSIRMLLQQYHDGLTVSELAERLEKDRASINQALELMVDAYIDRWTSRRKQWAAVWCVVVTPENCPKPTEKPK
jgi:predicted transcriptional regulator